MLRSHHLRFIEHYINTWGEVLARAIIRVLGPVGMPGCVCVGVDARWHSVGGGHCPYVRWRAVSCVWPPRTLSYLLHTQQGCLNSKKWYNFLLQYSLSRLDVVGEWEKFVTLPGIESLYLGLPLRTSNHCITQLLWTFRRVYFKYWRQVFRQHAADLCQCCMYIRSPWLCHRPER